MKKLLLLFAALLVAGCGEKKESVITGGGEKAEDPVTGGGEKAEDSVITGKWAHESNSDLVMWEFFEDGSYKEWGVREKGTYQILDGNRLQMKEGPHSTFIENLQISKTELTGKISGGNVRWLRK